MIDKAPPALPERPPTAAADKPVTAAASVPPALPAKPTSSNLSKKESVAPEDEVCCLFYFVVVLGVGVFFLFFC